MEIKLTKKESEEYFYNALCNGLGYISNHGLVLECDENYYNLVKTKLGAESPGIMICYEDVLMEILRSGGKLTLVDEEDDDSEQTKSITLEDVHNNVQTAPTKFLLDMITENDDADTADVILQTVFYKEIIFG